MIWWNIWSNVLNQLCISYLIYVHKNTFQIEINKSRCWACCPVGTDQLLNVESTLIQRWASTFLNHPQRWYLVEKSLILKQWSTKTKLLNHNSTKNQPSLKLKCQSWKMVEIWLTVGWFLVELWLRSWFLVDHCFKINDFSTKYQRWYLVEKLICAHRVGIW